MATQRKLIQTALGGAPRDEENRVAVKDVVDQALGSDRDDHDGRVFGGSKTPRSSARRELYRVLDGASLLVKDGRGYLRFKTEDLQDVVLHGDAWDVLALVPDDSLSVIVADPPWSHLSEHRSRGTTTRMTTNSYFAERDLDEALVVEYHRALKPGGYLCLYLPPFARTSASTWARVLSACEEVGFEAVREVVWKKQRSMGYRWTGTHEPILCFSKGKPRACEDRAATSFVEASAPRGASRTPYRDFTEDDEVEWEAAIARHGKASRIPREERKRLKGRYHDTEKPVEVARHLLRVAAEPGGLLLECFAGTGHACVAAKEFGMSFVAVEGDKRAVYGLLAPRLGDRLRAVIDVPAAAG